MLQYIQPKEFCARGVNAARPALPPSEPPLIVVHNVCKKSDDRQHELLRNVSFEVKPGQVVGLVSESRFQDETATLLALLAGFETADGGQLTIAGQKIGQLVSTELLSWRTRHLSLAVGPGRLLPALSVLQNVLLVSNLFRQEQESTLTPLERASRLVGLVGLTSESACPVADLRPELHKRVGLARALANRAEIVLADGLEQSFDMFDLLKLLKGLQATGKTIVLKTTLEVARQLPQMVVLEDGQVLQEQLNAPWN